MKTKQLLSALAISFFVSNTIVLAQMPSQINNSNQMAMMLYPIEKGVDGQQYITTKAGYKITVPGLGISPTANQIAVYRDPANNFWYIDKTGNPTPVSSDQMQSVMAQIQNQAMQRGRVQYGQYPQNMPMQNMPYNTAPASPQQSVVVNQPPANTNSSNSSSGSSALMTGAAAAGGAALGSILTNAIYDNNNEPYYYHGVPYGAPVYREANGRYYYSGANGNHVYVAPNQNTAAMFNEYDKQGAWNNRQQWSQQANTASSNLQSQAQNANRTNNMRAEQSNAADLGNRNNAAFEGRHQRNNGSGGLRRGGRRFR